MKKKVTVKTNVMRMLDSQKISYNVFEYAWDEDQLDAIHASQEMGIPIEQVYKTIVLEGDKTGYFVACIVANQELNLKALAKISQNKKVGLLPIKELETITGYIRGGCSPIGMKKKFPTYIERHATQQPLIRISAGKRGIQVELNPFDLQQITNATWFDNQKE